MRWRSHRQQQAERPNCSEPPAIFSFACQTLRSAASAAAGRPGAPRSPSAARRTAARPSQRGTARRCRGRQGTGRAQPLRIARQSAACPAGASQQRRQQAAAAAGQHPSPPLRPSHPCSPGHPSDAAPPKPASSALPVPTELAPPSRGHAVAEEDAGVALRHHHAGAAGAQGDRRVLAARAAPAGGQRGAHMTTRPERMPACCTSRERQAAGATTWAAAGAPVWAMLLRLLRCAHPKFWPPMMMGYSVFMLSTCKMEAAHTPVARLGCVGRLLAGCLLQRNRQRARRGCPCSCKCWHTALLRNLASWQRSRRTST